MKTSRLSRSTAVAFAVLCALAPAWAQEDAEPLFLSVTRTPEPWTHLPSNISVITQQDIARSGAKTLDEVLDLYPAVDVQRTGTLGSFNTLRLRGVPSSAQVQVLVDDQPLGGVSTQFVDLSQIPLENVDRVEVVRGASSALYGANTIGGVVHIITRRHGVDRPLSSIGVEGRAFGTQIYRGDIGARGAGFDGRVTGSRYFTDGFQQNADGNNVTVSGNSGYTFANGARLGLDVFRSDHDIGDPQGTLVPLGEWNGERERAAANPAQRVEQNNNLGRVNFSLPLGAWGSVQSTVHGSRLDYVLRPNAGASASFDLDNRIWGQDTRFQLPGGLTVGGAYERDERRVVGEPARHIVNWGAYVQQAWDAGPLSLVPAVRLDQHSAFGNVVNPRLTAIYRPAEAWKVSANAARSFRAPTFVDLYYPGYSNPDLDPETAWTYDLGTEFRTAAGGTVGVTGFYTRLRNRIAYDVAMPVNAPRAEMSGVEVESGQRVGPFFHKTNYTYQRAVGNSLASSAFVPLRLTPRHMANEQLTWVGRTGWSLTNSVQYVHKQYQLDGEKGLKLPSYTVWNARLAKKILGAEAYLGVDNITNKRYAEAIGSYFDPLTLVSSTTLYPQPGRTFWGGITMRFTD
jgi:vitamin B12 transporter